MVVALLEAGRRAALDLDGPHAVAGTEFKHQVDLGPARTETTTRPDNTYTTTTYSGGLPDVTAHYASNGGTPIATVAIRTLNGAAGSGYDGLKRPIYQTDSRTGTNTTAYISATCDAVASITDPGNRETKFTYDSRGNRTKVNAPDTTAGTNETNTTYDSYSRVETVTGAQTYPVSYTYDYAGRMKTMKTYRTPTSTAITTWNYSDTTGLLEEKLDNSNKGPLYTYTPGGRLKTRLWARGRLTSYGYTHGLLTTVTYSGNDSTWQSYLTARAAWLDLLNDDPPADEGDIEDAKDERDNAYATFSSTADPSTPAVHYEFDSLGRTKTITQEKQSQLAYGYDDTTTSTPPHTATLALDTETICYDLDSNGVFGETSDFTRVIDRADRSLGRNTGFTLGTVDTPNSEQSVSYDYHATTGRLSTVSNGTDIFTYGYVDDSNLLSTTTKNGDGNFQVIRTYEDTRDVLETIENKIDGTVKSKYDYTVNAIGQRTNLTTSGDAFGTTLPTWSWHYDTLGQLEKADTNVADQPPFSRSPNRSFAPHAHQPRPVFRCFGGR